MIEDYYIYFIPCLRKEIPVGKRYELRKEGFEEKVIE
jgi:hypothetical protein